MHGLVSGIAMLIGGLELLALGTWLYMKSALGSGPRDALMVALARKFGRSAGACRAVVDVLVTVIGFFLGGPVGVGTIISAVGLGPLINLNLQPCGSVRKCIRKMWRKPLRELPESGNSPFFIINFNLFVVASPALNHLTHWVCPFLFAYAQNSPVKHKTARRPERHFLKYFSLLGNGGSVQRPPFAAILQRGAPVLSSDRTGAVVFHCFLQNHTFCAR